MTERTRRLFLALWPSDDLRQQIEHETREAARYSGGRVIPAANLHITLAFLGATPESKLPDAIACTKETAVRPFELVLGELKWWERQQLLCLEPVAGVEPLQVLVGRLQNALRGKGFAIERRPFRPHVTLTREVKREHEVKPIMHKSIVPLRWQVQRIELVESQTLPTGSTYSVLPT